jgi:glycosyltransferase involved in cell wall biosynthesis
MGKSGNPAKQNLKGTIGWASNSPTAQTGYGVQTAQALSRMKRDGLDVAAFSNFGLEGVASTWDSGHGLVPHLPRGYDTYSNDVVPAHMDSWAAKFPDQPSLLITLYDVWVFKGKAYDKHNIASWVPVDHMPAPPAVMDWLKKPNVTPIAMSRYGQQVIEAAGVKSLYVPHAIEPVFQPTETIDGVPAREYLGVDRDAFLIGMNAANKGVYPNRKCFAENLLAFKIFADRHPDAQIYLHTDVMGAAGGLILPQLLEAIGLRKEQVVIADPYEYRVGYSQEQLAGIYTAMDVLLATSLGEGFGVPTVEAQACGTPVIVSDFAASAELIGDGWAIKGQPLWDAPQRSWFMTPLVDGIVDALEEAYYRKREKSAKAIEFAKQYDAEKVYSKYWIPALQTLLSKQL